MDQEYRRVAFISNFIKSHLTLTPHPNATSSAIIKRNQYTLNELKHFCHPSNSIRLIYIFARRSQSPDRKR